MIAGVVGDAREFGLAREPTPTVYTCTAAIAFPPLAFLVRTHGDPPRWSTPSARSSKEIQPLRSVYDVTPLSGAWVPNMRRTVCARSCSRCSPPRRSRSLARRIRHVELRRELAPARGGLAPGARGGVARHRRVVRRKALPSSESRSSPGSHCPWRSARVLAGMLFGVSAGGSGDAGGVSCWSSVSRPSRLSFPRCERRASTPCKRCGRSRAGGSDESHSLCPPPTAAPPRLLRRGDHDARDRHRRDDGDVLDLLPSPARQPRRRRARSARESRRAGPEAGQHRRARWRATASRCSATRCSAISRRGKRC